MSISINGIKKAGAMTALKQAIDSALWNAKNNLEKMTNQDCLDFLKYRALALAAIEEATELHSALMDERKKK